MAATANSALQTALLQLIQRASEAASAHTEPALKRLKSSQHSLEEELKHLDAEMQRITETLETVTLDPQTSKLMEEVGQCLKRTRVKLTTIRGRLGRLKVYEELDRLRLNSSAEDSKTPPPPPENISFWEDTPQ
ncbi:hypothetical protein BWQ96_00486 [Gracilariopsis chorda]|uniref:Biogenesis of lysosome-related organelles complex 1 subunit 7 n=1 Tax=Gracilariopsis chorda TaxID=448386 RepID=A0A2V3J633_9FLOR|nr:hypothetical protein BWQ96_00486 [Gracilariopsis chorda]|eukprot:PXF49834.1 hypothetical protein BWQ96_00486 [Gracilariopsis chorda]